MRQVDTFFEMLRAIYGAQKFSAQWPTVMDRQAAMTLWGDQIRNHTPEELRAAINHAQSMSTRGERDWQWPNIGLILSGAKNNNPAHQLFLPEPERNLESAEERAKRARSLRQELGL